MNCEIGHGSKPECSSFGQGDIGNLGPVRKIHSMSLDIQEYAFKLRLKEPLGLPLCKGKYFRFQVVLANVSGIDYLIREKVTLGVRLYTGLKPHREITMSLRGAEIIKGNKNAEIYFDEKLHLYLADFKIQINEVSSHFSGINLFVQANDSDFIEKTGLAIKPLLVKDISIKSKEKICRKIRDASN